MARKRSKGIDALARALEALEAKSNPNRIEPSALAADNLMAPYPGALPAPKEVLRHWQLIRDRRNYTPAPIIPIEHKPAPTELKWWDYVEIDRKEIPKRERERLEYNWRVWTKPVDNYGVGENRAPLHVFFAILDDNGVSKSEFDWKAFREHYFALHPQQQAKYQAHQKEWRKSEKGKAAKRAYDRKRKSQRRQELRAKQKRGGLF